MLCVCRLRVLLSQNGIAAAESIRLETEALSVFKEVTSHLFAELVQAAKQETAGEDAGAAKVPVPVAGAGSEGSKPALKRQGSSLLNRVGSLLGDAESGAATLSKMQLQVLSLVAAELQREVLRVTDGKEPATQEYIHELVIIVQTLCSSGAARAHIGRSSILENLVTLLRFGTVKVQLLTIAVLATLLPGLAPTALDKQCVIAKGASVTWLESTEAAKPDPGAAIASAPSHGTFTLVSKLLLVLAGTLSIQVGLSSDFAAV